MTQPSLAFITGAASGLGKELAFQLAKKKVPLFLTSKNKQELMQIKQELLSLTRVTILPADLSISKDLLLVLEALKKEKPDLIINNAGLGFYGEILEGTLEEQLLILKVNIEALVSISIESARVLKEEKRKGTIMNISSSACFFTYPSFALYAASKNFVKEFSLSFDEELRPFNIRVLTALPGRFISKFQQKAAKKEFVSPSIWDMSVYKTAQKILEQIKKEKAYQVIDLRYQILCFLAKWIPRRWMGKLLKKKT